MKRTIVSLLLVLIVLVTGVCACAEQAVPSVIVSQVIVPKGETTVPVDSGFIVALTVLQEETVEKQVFDEIVAVAQNENETVSSYFGEEVMTNAAVYLPEDLDVATLVMDEFFVLTEENYKAEYGDVTATFEFVTPYEDGTVLVAMVGVLPDENAGEDAEIEWVPFEAVASEGKVQVSFTQEILETLKVQKCVFALLRAE